MYFEDEILELFVFEHSDPYKAAKAFLEAN